MNIADADIWSDAAVQCQLSTGKAWLPGWAHCSGQFGLVRSAQGNYVVIDRVTLGACGNFLNHASAAELVGRILEEHGLLDEIRRDPRAPNPRAQAILVSVEGRVPLRQQAAVPAKSPAGVNRQG